MDDLPVSRREDNIVKRWNLSLRIPEKESNKQCNENPKKSQQNPAHRKKEDCDQSQGDQKGEPFFSDRPAAPIHQSFFSLSQLIMKCELAAMDAIRLRRFRRNFTPPDHGHMAGPDQFFYPEGLEQSEKGVYLLLVSRDFDGIGFRTHIDHFSPEDVGDP